MSEHYLAQVKILDHAVKFLDESKEKQQLQRNIALHQQNAPLIDALLDDKNAFFNQKNQTLVPTFNQQINHTFDRVSQCILTMLEGKTETEKHDFLKEFKNSYEPESTLEARLLDAFIQDVSETLELPNTQQSLRQQRG